MDTRCTIIIIIIIIIIIRLFLIIQLHFTIIFILLFIIKRCQTWIYWRTERVYLLSCMLISSYLLIYLLNYLLTYFFKNIFLLSCLFTIEHQSDRVYLFVSVNQELFSLILVLWDFNLNMRLCSHLDPEHQCRGDRVQNTNVCYFSVRDT